MLYVMARSAMWAWEGQESQEPGDGAKESGEGSISINVVDRDVVRRLLVPQFFLAFLALTSYHVQIITRLSSGYPVWYWWLACLSLDDAKRQTFGRSWNCAKIIIGWMVGYALIQAGLFASFLPPA